MRKLRLLLVLVVALWIVGEFLIIPFAESQIEKRVAEKNRDATAVTADIDSFPLIARVLFTGKAKKVTVTLDRVARQSVDFAKVDFALEGISIDRATILRGNPRITDIDTGTITATIELAGIGRIAGIIDRLAGSAGLTPEMDGHTLRIGGASLDISSDLFPCEPEATVNDDEVVLSCTITEVPEALLDAAQR